MSLNIDNQEADRLAHAVASMTGETITQAVINSLKERLQRTQYNALNKENILQEALAISRHCSSLPVHDNRTADEILGYNKNGLPS